MVPAIAGYEILEQLGEGGMGQVYKARHLRLDRIVALKVIHPDHLAQPDAVRRFHREARAAARLAHPNLVTIFDVDDVGGTHFLAMEYVEGTDLGRWVKSWGPLAAARACDYVRQAALGLQHIHERGLVHRDIKPSNLFMTANETLVKVLDLGLARLDQPGPSDQISNQLTQPGVVMGTPAFLAPEQARDSRRVDIRSDIYSLGCTLYYLLTGRVPFPGTGLAEIIVQHQLDEPEPVEKLRPDVPPGVPAVVRKMMAKRPQDRYQTPAEVAAVLASFCPLAAFDPTPSDPAGGHPALGTPSPPRFPSMDPIPSATEMLQVQDSKAFADQAQRRKWRNRLTLDVALLAAFLLCLLAVVVTSVNRNEPETKVPIATIPPPSAQETKRAEEYNQRALAYNEREYDKAIADFGEAIRLNPRKVEYYENRGKKYVLRAQEYSTKNDYDNAIADFTDGIRLAPNEARLWNARGSAYLNKGDWQKALPDINETIRLAPWPDHYCNRGCAYMLKGDYAAAILDLDRSIQLNPRYNTRAFFIRGLVYFHRQEYDRAIADLTEAIEGYPSFAGYAHQPRGEAYLKKGDLDKALADLNKAIMLNPSPASPYAVRSEIYAKRLFQKPIRRLALGLCDIEIPVGFLKAPSV
jgi:serine/threonine-protein kinase